jgi:hypothetical protein
MMSKRCFEKVGKLIVYRHDFREIENGETMISAGDHYWGLTGDQQLTEDAIRAGKPDGTRFRAESLYVYSDAKMAEQDWKRKPGRYLYKLEIDDDVIRHSGDLQVYSQVTAAIRKNEPQDELVKKYWTPVVEAGRYTELLVADATVVELLKHANEYKSPIQRANAKLRDDPDNIEFYELMSKKVVQMTRNRPQNR